jgi:hypothetical protein
MSLDSILKSILRAGFISRSRSNRQQHGYLNPVVRCAAKPVVSTLEDIQVLDHEGDEMGQASDKSDSLIVNRELSM